MLASRVGQQKPNQWSEKRGDEVEDHGIRVVHVYIGDDHGDDDEPEMEDCRVTDISDDELMVRRFGEKHEDVAIIVDCGADVICSL